MTPRLYRWMAVLALLPALVGCGDPFHVGPILSGVVRLDASLADVNGAPAGTQTVTTADGVRVWLVEAGQAVDSTLTQRGAYAFVVRRNHSYRTQFGVPPAFVDSSEQITPTRDASFLLDTLQLGRAGNLTSRPNPFETQLDLSFQLAADTFVRIGVYDLSARQVRVLAVRTFVAGSHVLLWDGKDDSANEVSDGMYWVLLQSVYGTQAELVVKQPAS